MSSRKIASKLTKKIEVFQTNFEKRNNTFEKKVEKQINDLSKLCDKSCSDVNDVTDKMQKVKVDVRKFENNLDDIKRMSIKDRLEYLARLQDIKIATHLQSGNQVVPYEKTFGIHETA